MTEPPDQPRPPVDLDALLARPWSIAVVIAAAFMLPLLLGDLVGGDAPARQVAAVRTAPLPVPDGQPQAGARIPDLRRAPALPRLAPPGEPPAAEPAAAAEPSPAAAPVEP